MEKKIVLGDKQGIESAVLELSSYLALDFDSFLTLWLFLASYYLQCDTPIENLCNSYNHLIH